MATQDNRIIEVRNVNKVFDGIPAVKEVSLSIKRGEFVTFLGPSGCGKTTLLRMIAGFEKPTSGEIFFDGKDITDIPPHKRPINTVFQKYALFPHLNVFNNIAFGLKLKSVPTGEFVTNKKTGEKFEKMRKLTKKEIEEKVNYVLKLVDLEDYGHRNVNSLSGGQQQRVAIARAIVNKPKLLICDEPTGNLDSKASEEIISLLKLSNKKYNQTVIVITHDEKIALEADRIITIEDGKIIKDERNG